MNERILANILARPDHGLSAADATILRKMVVYLDRSSLRIVWDDGAQGRDLVLHLSDDAVRYCLSVGELITLWEHMRAGQPIDWTTLPTVPGRAPHTHTGDPNGSPV